jgi:ABC-2 type transport system permease protein
VVDGTAKHAGPVSPPPAVPYRTFIALVSAGFRRYSTYRQATVAGIFTNSVFGFLHCYVLLAVAAGGRSAGYSASQLATYVWVTQGLLATVGLWGDTLLADRIRSGEVVADLLRPVPAVTMYLAGDLGRAGYAAITRFTVPVVLGLIAFDLYLPTRAMTYLLFAVSVALACLLSFGCRYLVNATAYWLLDARGPQLAWTVCSGLLGGMYFPLRFLPAWLYHTVVLATPFPSLLQAPLDIVTERVSTVGQLSLVAIQAVWMGAILAAARLVQHAAQRRLVVQGG